MTPPPSTPRLFADYAASPSPAERRAFRKWNRADQGSLFAAPVDVDRCAGVCPVCASADHAADVCPHGTAGTLL